MCYVQAENGEVRVASLTRFSRRIRGRRGHRGRRKGLMPRVRAASATRRTTACAHCTECVCRQVRGRKRSPRCGGSLAGDGCMEVEKKYEIKIRSSVAADVFRVSQTRLFTHYLPRAPALRTSRDRREQSHVVTPRYRSWEFIFAVFFLFRRLKKENFLPIFKNTFPPQSPETGIRCVRPSGRRRRDVCKLKPGFLVWRRWRILRSRGRCAAIPRGYGRGRGRRN